MDLPEGSDRATRPPLPRRTGDVVARTDDDDAVPDGERPWPAVTPPVSTMVSAPTGSRTMSPVVAASAPSSDFTNPTTTLPPSDRPTGDVDQAAFIARRSWGGWLGWPYYLALHARGMAALTFAVTTAPLFAVSLLVPLYPSAVVVPALLGALAWALIATLLIGAHGVIAGRRITWQVHHWRSFAQFRRSQHLWDVIGRSLAPVMVIATVALVLGALLLVVVPAKQSEAVASDVAGRATLDRARAAAAACFTRMGGTYRLCDSNEELLARGLLAEPVGGVLFDAAIDGARMVMSVELGATRCDARTERPYLVFDTATGTTLPVCASQPPSLTTYPPQTDLPYQIPTARPT